MNSVYVFNLPNMLMPVVVAIIFMAACSLFYEPNRRHFSAIMIAGAGDSNVVAPCTGGIDGLCKLGVVRVAGTRWYFRPDGFSSKHCVFV